MSGRPGTPRVSVIVPVRNGARDVEQLLECLAKQTLPRSDFEVVIGDDGSTDDISMRARTSDGDVRVVSGPASNAYTARNRAVRYSHARVLAFCDADCRPQDDWLERGLEALEAADVVAGRIRFSIPRSPNIWSLLDAESTKNHEQQVRLGNAETANLFVRRELFERVGGFDDGQPGYGDFDFVERCIGSGATLLYAPAALVEHPVRMRAVAFLNNVWSMNFSYAIAKARSGGRPDGLKLREWVPVVQTIRSRRRFGMSLRLDRRWLGQSGASPTLAHELQAIPLTYVVVPYVRSTAQLHGWLRGRRERAVEEPADKRAQPRS